MSGKLFRALVPLDHTADHCIYPVGAVVSLDHLSKEQVAILLDRGYVRPEAEAEVKAEAKVKAEVKA